MGQTTKGETDTWLITFEVAIIKGGAFDETRLIALLKSAQVERSGALLHEPHVLKGLGLAMRNASKPING